MHDFSLWITNHLKLNGKQYVVGIPIFEPSESGESLLVNDYCGPLYGVTARCCKPLGKRQVLLGLSERPGFIWECSTLDFPRGEFLLTSRRQRVIYDGPVRIDNANNLFPGKVHCCNAFLLNGLFCIIHNNTGTWFRSWFKKPSNAYALTVFGTSKEQLNGYTSMELFRLREYLAEPILKVADVYLNCQHLIDP